MQLEIIRLILNEVQWLTNAQVEEENWDLDGVDEEVVDDLNRQCGLHLIHHLFKCQHLPTKAQAIVP